MSDRIAVMDQGRVLQIGTPVEIYEQPASRFIAEFIGESNLLDGTALDVDGAVCSIDIDGTTVTGRLTQNNAAVQGQAVTLLVRPEMIRLHSLDASEKPKLNGTVREIIYQGSVVRYRIQIGHQHVMVEVANRPDLARLDLDDDVDAALLQQGFLEPEKTLQMQQPMPGMLDNGCAPSPAAPQQQQQFTGWMS